MGRRAHLPDADPDETGEWLEALRDVAGTVSYTHLTLPTT